MLNDYELFYTAAKLKAAIRRRAVTGVITNNGRITFISADGLKDGILVTRQGDFKNFSSDDHAQYKIDQLKGDQA